MTVSPAPLRYLDPAGERPGRGDDELPVVPETAREAGPGRPVEVPPDPEATAHGRPLPARSTRGRR